MTLATGFCQLEKAPNIPSPFPLPGDRTRALTGPACPGLFATQGGASQPELRPGLCLRERLTHVPAFPGPGVLCAPTLWGRGRRQEGAGAGSVVCGLLSFPLCFHGDFISSKLLIELHIYDQKIKSLDLFEAGFYES